VSTLESGRGGQRARAPGAARGLVLPVAFLLWAGWTMGVHEIRSAGEFHRAIVLFGPAEGLPCLKIFADIWRARVWPLIMFTAFLSSCQMSGVRVALFAAGANGAKAVGERRTSFAAGRLRLGIPLTLPLGLSFMGLSCFAVALNGLACPGILAALVLAPLVQVRSRRFLPALKKLPALPRDPLALCSATAIAASLALVLIASLAPELKVDPLMYHYAKAKQVLLAHKFTPLSSSILDFFPSMGEMLTTLLLNLGGETATRWLNPFLLAVLAAGTYRAGRLFLPPTWSWAAAALTFTSPLLASQAVQAKNDILLAVFSMGAVLWCMEFRERSKGIGMAPAGWLAGSAFAVKYTGGYLLPALALGLAVVKTAKPRVLLAITAGFLAASLPTLVNNWITTGDPVYPAAYTLLPSPFFSRIAGERLREMLNVITLQDPSAVSKWRNFEGLWNPAGGESTFLRWAVFIPAALMAGTWNQSVKFAAAVLAALAVAWFAGPAQVRYGIAMFPLGSLIAAFALAHSSVPGGLFGRRLPAGGGGAKARMDRRRKPAPSVASAAPGAAIMTAALALQMFHVAASPDLASSLAAGAGLIPPDSFRARGLTSLHDIAGIVNTRTGPRARILSYGETRAAVFERRIECAVFGKTNISPYDIVHASFTSAEVWKRVRQRGWSHLLYNRLTAFFWKRSVADDPWTERDLSLWAEWWRRHAELVSESPIYDRDQGYYYLFRLVPRTRSRVGAVLPGIEGWVYRLEQETLSGRTAAAKERFAALKRAAGDFAIVDLIEAERPGERVTRERRYALLKRAVARGWKSPGVYSELAGTAAGENREEEAAVWAGKARLLLKR